MNVLAKIKRNLIQALEYSKSIQQIRGKTLSDYTKRPIDFFYLEQDLRNFDNVDISQNSDSDFWIRIARIDRTLPPIIPDICKGFLEDNDISDYKKIPVLDPVASIKMDRHKANELLESEIITASDIRLSQDITDNENEVDVLVKASKYKKMVDVFENWLENSWKLWAEVEKAKEPQIKLYRNFFKLEQDIRRTSEDELILGQNLVVLKGESTHEVIKAPLIEYSLDITIDEGSGYSVNISPKDAPPRLVSAPFKEACLPGATRIVAEIQRVIDQRTQETEGEISPFDSEFSERITNITAGFLHPQSIADFENSRIPDEKEYPICTTIWFIARRPKSQEPYIENVESLIEQILEADSEDNLPKTALAFGSEPSDEKIYSNQSDTTLTSGNKFSYVNINELDLEKTEYFFPLATNDEQLAILKLLEKGDAVSVQGPPGTGKSHTIANIIAHYIATGRRVLVSAKTPEALSGVRNKLPDYLSRLTISILNSDSEGKSQVEEAVRYLSSEAQGANLPLILEEKERVKNKIKENKIQIQHIDSALEKHASNQLAKIDYKGEELSTAEIVKLILSESEQYSWFPDDLGLGEEYNLKFDSTIIQRIKELRKILNEFIIYDPDTIPPLEQLLDIPSLQNLHVQLCKFNKISYHLQSGQLLEPSNNVKDIDIKIESLKKVFELIFRAKSCFNESSESVPLLQSVLNVQSNRNETEEIRNLLEDVSKWFEKYKGLRIYRINYSSFDWKNKEIYLAVKNLANAKKPFGITGIFKKSLKHELSKISIRASEPENLEDWQKVWEILNLLHQGETLINKWNGLAEFFGFFRLTNDIESTFELLSSNHSILDLRHLPVKNWSILLEDIKQMFPFGIAHEEISNFNDVFERIYNSIINWSAARNLESATNKKYELIKIAKIGEEGVFQELMDLTSLLGNHENDVEEIGAQYRVIYSTFSKLNSVRDELEELKKLCKLVEANKAVNWAKQLSSLPMKGYEDGTCPSDWLKAWEHARVRGFINSLPSRKKINELLQQKLDLEAQILKLNSKLIELQALIGLKQNMTKKISSALARFSAAFSKIGKSIFSVRSRRHLKEANQAMMDCYDAIPCWIIPESKVEHHIPAKLKAFDLVIIDEASQSDITSLPIILRGEKLLVVGDDKQVSPSFIGISESKINTLIEDCLSDHPLKNSFDPRNSLYDLIGIISPGQRVSLQEHFRCVEPIINYCSKNFYSEPLIPLRIANSRERLDPPLIDIYVEGGEKNKDININEAEVIVNEIVKITEDPNMSGRSIGVICLLGFKQALLIDKLIIDRIGIDKHEQHKILCGDARYFQGQEKDIIYLSMVASKNDLRAQTTREDKQKYNVAVSRARDRLVLVRSVLKEQLNNPEDLKLSLLEHFERPIDMTSSSKNLIDKCGSQFERDVFARLTQNGYRVIPQFKVGSYSIDFVIEGENDKRLAIELDGDMYHGPEQFAHDQHRQKQLERVGWEFWRCWASDWNRNSEQCFKELLNELDKKGISPLGSEYESNVYTRFETVKLSKERSNSEIVLSAELEELCSEI